MTEVEELRAEIKRLRGVDCGVTDLDGTTTPLCGICLECAFLRGAKAMREEAARLVDEMLSHTLTDAADRIRDLTIPEDEP